MNLLQKITRFTLLPLAILGPFWMVWGRAFANKGGWLGVMQMFTLAPASLIILLILMDRLRKILSVKQTGMLPRRVTIEVLSLYLAMFAYGFFVVDGGDTPESIGGIATVLFGNGFTNVSTSLSQVAEVAGIILLIVLFTEAKRLRHRA